MTGAMSRRKGAREELRLVGELHALGITSAYRKQRDGAARDDSDDVGGIPGEFAECRVRGALRIVEWMREIEAKAPRGYSPTLYFRLSNRSRSTGFYVCQSLADHVDLLLRAEA